MAHNPWELKAIDTDYLFNCGNSYLNWNFNEFVHASTILFHFHKLASFVESLEINISQNFSSEDKSEEKNLNINLDLEQSNLYVNRKRNEKGINKF